MGTYTMIKYICLGLVTFVSWFFFKNLIHYLFGIYDIDNHNSRVRQLDFSLDRKIGEDKKREEEKQLRELIDKVTAPIIKHVIPNVSYTKDLSTLEQNLRFTGADKYFTAIQYTAMILLGRVLGIMALVLLFPYSKFLAILWFFGPFVMPTLLFKNTIVNKKEVLLLGFPEFINISKSYLVSGMSFEKAVEESICYVNKEWQEILKRFLINSDTLPRKECLQILADDANSFEIKEFMSLVQLNMEQGIDIKDSFERQYEKIKDLQLLAIQKKIQSRSVWCILIQGPVLLTIFIAFGLPMANSMVNFTTL